MNSDNSPLSFVLYCANSLAMATDFAGFYHEFESRGIKAEYLSIISLEDTIARYGKLIYGRDDNGKLRIDILDAGHEIFYTVISDPKVLKVRTLGWLKSSVRNARSAHNIVFVIISHGAASGSVVIGGQIDGETGGPRKVSCEYLTIPEVKNTIASIPNGAYFTLINTACYSGKWVSIAKDFKGNRFVHAASGSDQKAQNFRTASAKCREGIFVTALLECLKRPML